MGKLVIAQGTVTYPTTANSSSARISGLPFTASTNGGGFSMYNTAGISIVMRNQSSSTNTFLTNASTGSTDVSNATMSTRDLQFSFIYQATA